MHNPKSLVPLQGVRTGYEGSRGARNVVAASLQLQIMRHRHKVLDANRVLRRTQPQPGVG